MALPETQSGTNRVRVLVVDDSAFMRKSLSSMLEANKQIQVVGVARNGEEAVQQVLQLKPDVVTMDVEMPGMTGLQALQQIMAKHPVPVIMGDGWSTYKQPITLYIENGILYAAVRFDASTRTTISHQTTIVAGEFTHYALVRNGATITLYLNGVAGTTTINSGALSLYPSDISHCFISLARKVEYSTTTYLDGLHDEFRYRREAVYTTNFTPPTAPFTF